ncbi:PREDICTED: synaptic vesicle glycoprotein 2C-like [Nicrophorus vespilloides]|uniref:Synaptic vesicle glycoprotein 2C-like n=1 Tax=Nicrophorus vespilloides TaxID=110193 RepID=A0ABM1N9U4_NICVS|nr:PREDICTED: synaptic vesicle glycoprotein 2C-like [Nicrophorus vespilloides]
MGQSAEDDGGQEDGLSIECQMDSKSEISTIQLSVVNNNKPKSDDSKFDFTSTDIEDALEETGFGKFHLFLILTCGLILYAVTSECYSIGYILPAAQCDLNLSVDDKSLLTSIGFIGVMTTQFIWGFVSDTKGRKNCLIYTLFLTVLFSLGSCLSPYLWLFLIFRFLNGVTISCASGTVFAYMGEFLAMKHRQTSIMISCIFIGLSIFLLPCMAWAVLPLKFSWNIFGFEFLPWRLFILISSAPTLSACVALFFLPESPKYLLQVGRDKEALKVLRTIHSWNFKNEKFKVKKLNKPESVERKDNVIVGFLKQIYALFTLKYLKSSLVTCSLQFGTLVASSGLLLWYPDILLQVSKSTEEATVCQAISSGNQFLDSGDDLIECSNEIGTSIFTQNIYIGVAYLIGFVINCLGVKRLGIRMLLILYLISSALATALLYWVTDKLAIDILYIIVLAGSGLCVGLVNTAVIDLFPTHLRAMAGCVTIFCGRLGSVISSSIFGHLLQWNCDITYFLYAFNLLGCAILSIFIYKRTAAQ